MTTANFISTILTKRLNLASRSARADIISTKFTIRRGVNLGKKRKQPNFRCKSEAQKRAIAANYARMAAQKKRSAPPPQQPKPQSPITPKKEFPDKFPFWARFKPNKNRTTLVIDEEQVKRKNSDMVDDCFVHREAIHCDDDNKYVLSGDYEKVFPNPDTSDNSPMYLKRPHKHPKRMFAPHNKNLTMPEDLRQRYEKNNVKNKGDDKKE